MDLREVNTGLMEKLLSYLGLEDLIFLSRTCTGFRAVLDAAPTSTWSDAAARVFPARHPLVAVNPYGRHGVLRYLQGTQHLHKGLAASRMFVQACRSDHWSLSSAGELLAVFAEQQLHLYSVSGRRPQCCASESAPCHADWTWHPISWSPDDSKAVGTGTCKQSEDKLVSVCCILLVSSDGASAAQQLQEQCLAAMWSPDGQMLVTSGPQMSHSVLLSQQLEILYKLPFSWPTWTPDSQLVMGLSSNNILSSWPLAYSASAQKWVAAVRAVLQADWRRMTVMDLQISSRGEICVLQHSRVGLQRPGGECEFFFFKQTLFYRAFWSPGGALVLLLSPHVLQVVNAFGLSKPRLVGEVEVAARSMPCWAPDGRVFAYFPNHSDPLRLVIATPTLEPVFTMDLPEMVDHGLKCHFSAFGDAVCVRAKRDSAGLTKLILVSFGSELPAAPLRAQLSIMDAMSTVDVQQPMANAV